ncbi:hypothetical protein BBK36DRAFT_1116614 [Trichoderma citrinoviride]|uniref:Peroxin 26 n=1 Tax=Trichoderma citrinoviride TaxID=58853 RepID=A0A2T4BDB8_9HYPO|nr:hypothetical protein BBK36DRAFT_1116614 [Trichoderma citrinoviride]PTB67327.1 hypothetical protein BBK36DRAFT_1116614 [Trichoderma citrinoviride]
MAYGGSYTASFNPAMSSSESFGSGLLASSISSLSSSGSKRISPVSKTYRQASTLFLTRRLPEALSTLRPIITPPSSADDGEPVPVAKSSRGTRIKVWSLYLTLLNAIVELEPEEGKEAFGNQEWRALCTKVRDGSIWEEVVKNGYHGVEGDVDADVVINLATLLLAHARDQSLNQKMLENFLASSNIPNLDLNDFTAPSRRYQSPARRANGANTPGDLNSRVKLLELYTLHVLPQNNEWDYAREFISVSAVLDEERKEAFLQALQSLQEEQEEHERQEREERKRQEEQLQKDIAEAKRLKAENEEKERKRLDEERQLRETSEGDYGIEQTPSFSGVGRAQPPGSPQNSVARPPRPTGKSRAKGTTASGSTTITARATMILSRFRHLFESLASSVKGNPAVITRLLVFTMGLLIMLGHKATRQRLEQIVGKAWAKVAATVGMGTKVSYI